MTSNFPVCLSIQLSLTKEKAGCSNSRSKKSTLRSLQEVADEWRQVQTAEGVQNLLWIIIKASMASPDADDWSPITRSNVLFLYERLHNLMHDLDPEHANQKLKGLWDLMECKAGQVHRSRQIFSK